MNSSQPTVRRGPLYQQLGWFVRLRWLAAAVAIIGALLDGYVLHWYEERAVLIGLLGGGLLALNGILWWILQSRASRSRVGLVLLAWGQILLDLMSLTLLVMWTGGMDSPVRGFFVFHMVFSSLLLSRRLAYGAATTSIALVFGGLWLTGRLPQEPPDQRILAGWGIMLLLTVYLSNHITRSLRRQRSRLQRQNRHIRLMSTRLRRQQQAMIQHEKMVAMGQMAAGITHEIANPLASMDTLLQLLRRKPEKTTPEKLDALRGQVERISQIVRQMATFAHPADGQWQEVDLNEIVETALQMVRFDPRIRGVHVERSLSPQVGKVNLIPQAIYQVLVNIVLNALDAMADVAEPRLRIRTDSDGGWRLVEIADNGHGISPSDAERLFEPFFTTKPVGKGTGLGLAISYSLIRKHGGDITVDGRPGQGARFLVRLPVVGPSSRSREASRGDFAVSENAPS